MTTHNPVNILLVDDEPANLVALDAVLGELGENIVRANSGMEALKHLLKNDFAAILLDVRMPAMDGFETARLIRSHPRSKTTPIIFVTASDGPRHFVEEAYTLGAVDFLTKPLIPAVIKAKVAVFVELFRRKEELRAAERRAVEAEFRKEKGLWQTTLSSIGDAVIATNTERKINFMNPEAERMTGWALAEALGHNLNDVFHIINESTRQVVDCPVSEVLSFGQVASLNTHTLLIARDGTERPIDDSAAPIRSDSGELYGVVLVFRDITEKHETSKRLQEAKEVLERRVAERTAELAKERAFLSAVLEAVEDGIVACDPNGMLTLFNRATRDFHGMAEEALPADQWSNHYDLFRPDGTPLPTEEVPLFRALEGEHVRDVEMVIAPPHGKARVVLASGRPLYDDVGRKLGAVISMHDVASQREAAAAREEAIREQARRQEAEAAARANAKFRTFFEQGSYFACVLTLDGTVVEANRLCLDACGFTREEVIGKKFWDCGWWNRSPVLMDMVQEGARQAAAGHIFRQETPYFIASGSERIVDLVIAPVTDENGRVLFIAPTGTDVTERNRVEERLRLLDAMSEATRTASDPKAIMDSMTRLLGEHLRATRCAYADLEADNDRFTTRHDWTSEGARSTVGVYSLDLFGPRAAAKLRKGLTLVIRDVDQELSSHEGADMFNAIGIKAIICRPLVRKEKLVALMAVHQDAPRNWTAEDIALAEDVVERSWAHIERVRATEALREADRRKSEFLATLAHELRNPLAPLQSGLQLIRLAGDVPAAVGKVRGMMERQLSHLVHLVDDLLDIARINHGKVDLQKERVELKTVLANAIETSLPLIEARGHDLITRTPDERILLDADPNRLSQVVSNLLNNAAKYTPSDGRIELTSFVDGNEVVISVTDSGIGIPPESLPIVFEMFTQVGNTDRAHGGLGIGLSLVRRLVELHGGSVTAKSRGIGQGSAFTIRLPLVAPGASRVPTHAPEPTSTSQGANRSIRVLVVDDNTDAAESLSALLELRGHTTRTAHDGPQALRAAKEFLPEVIFLDIGMPGMNGYEVARAIRKTPEIEQVALIALTGWGAENDRAQTRQAGFDTHLTKPVMLTAIDHVLSSIDQHAWHG